MGSKEMNMSDRKWFRMFGIFLVIILCIVLFIALNRAWEPQTIVSPTTTPILIQNNEIFVVPNEVSPEPFTVWVKQIVENGGLYNNQPADLALFVDAYGIQFWATCIEPGNPIPSIGQECLFSGYLVDCGDYQNFWFNSDQF
jgi:signal peptidase I